MDLHLDLEAPRVAPPTPPPQPDSKVLELCLDAFREQLFHLGSDQAGETHVVIAFVPEEALERLRKTCSYSSLSSRLEENIKALRGLLVEQGYRICGFVWETPAFLLENPFLAHPPTFHAVYEDRRNVLAQELRNWSQRFKSVLQSGYKEEFRGPYVFKDVLETARNAFLEKGYHASIHPDDTCTVQTYLRLVVTVP